MKKNSEGRRRRKIDDGKKQPIGGIGDLWLGRQKVLEDIVRDSQFFTFITRCSTSRAIIPSHSTGKALIGENNLCYVTYTYDARIS